MVYVRAKLPKNSNTRKLKVKIPDGLGVNYITPKWGAWRLKRSPLSPQIDPPETVPSVFQVGAAQVYGGRRFFD